MVPEMLHKLGNNNVLKIVYTVAHFPGMTSRWLGVNVNWLKNISIYGIDGWLHSAEMKGYVISKNSEKGLIYYITEKGRSAYNELLK